MLSFFKGDTFIVHNELEDGWLWVTNVRTDEQGLIVEDLVKEVVSGNTFDFKSCVSYWKNIKRYSILTEVALVLTLS